MIQRSPGSVSIANDARRLLSPIRHDIDRLLRRLVSTNTVAIPPKGNETAGQLLLQEFLKAKHVDVELYEVKFAGKNRNRRKRKDRDYAGRKNLVATLSGSGRGRSLLLNGHMDTVPAGNAVWSSSPWTPTERRGRIYGLGSFDMKGGLVAQAAVICALKRAGLRLAGDLVFESVIDEEWGGGGGTLAARLRGFSADACIISEGTQLEIYRATRGGFVVDLIVEAGDPNAYFSAGEVLSPTIPFGRLLGWVGLWSQRRRKLRRTGPYANFSDPAPVQVLAVESNRLSPETPLSVPSSAAVRIYFQFLPHEDVATVIAGIRDSLHRFEKQDPFFCKHSIEWTPLLPSPLLGHELQLNHPLTRCVANSVRTVLGVDAVVTAAPYPCDASLIHRDFGIPTLLFGPRGGGAHNPNEFVEKQSVIQTAEVLLTAALQWCQ